MTWPPPPDAPFWNLTKKEQAEYEAVVERDKDRCIECHGSWGEFHEVIPRGQGGKRVRGNMVLLCQADHTTGPEAAHGPKKREKQAKHLAYLLENEKNMRPEIKERAERRLIYLKG